MPRASIYTDRPLTAGMIEGLQAAARGESCRHFTDRSEHGARSYVWHALVDRGLMTEDNQITERGRDVLSSGGVSEDK